MRDDATASFDAFVAERSTALLRTAVLLTSDRRSAEHLVRAALITTYRHWRRRSRRGDPHADARRVLVAAAAGWRRRRSVQELVELPAVVPSGDRAVSDLSDRNSLAQALETLPPEMRAALVLRYWEDLSEADAAAAMGCAVDAGTTLTRRGLDLLRASLAEPRSRKEGGGPHIEQLVRAEFAERAHAVAASDPDLHRAVLDESRRERRRRAGILAGVLAVAVVLVSVPWMRGLLPPGRDVAEGDRGPSTRALDLYDLPTRGSLADDAQLIAHITRLSWGGGGPEEPGPTVDPAESTRRVLFVGEVHDDRAWALVEGTIRGRTVFAWFSGPADAAVSSDVSPEWSLAWGPDYAFADTPLALTDTATDPGPLVVVTKPGNEVLVRARRGDGVASGEASPVPTVEGVAVGTVPIPVSPGFVEVQVVRNGHVLYRTVARQFDSSADPAAGLIDGTAADRYALIMSECLSLRGFEVTPHPDGSFSYGPARGDPAVQAAYGAAVRECSVALGFE